MKASIGSKIKEARKRAGLTQDELALRLNLKRATISRYETGDIDIPSGTIVKIADVLNTSLVDLYGGADELYKAIDEINKPQDIFLEYLLHQGFRVWLSLGSIDKENPVPPHFRLLDMNTGKEYLLTTEKLDNLHKSINSFTKYQINEMLKEIEKE